MAAVNIKLNPVTVTVLAAIGLLFFTWSFGLWGSKGDMTVNMTVNMKQLLSASINAARFGGDAVKKIREDGGLNEQVKGQTDEGKAELKSNGDMASHHIMYYGLTSLFPKVTVQSEEHEVGKVDLSTVPDFSKIVDEVANIDDEYVNAEDITVWIDPLDATQEYTENLREYVTTMVCVAVKGKPTIGVIHRAFTKETYWAYLGHGNSGNLKRSLHEHAADRYTVIVSRSHMGPVESVAKKSLGEKTEVVPAGGAGFKTLEVLNGHADAYIHVTDIKKWDICAGNAIILQFGGNQTTLKGEEIDYSTAESAVNSDGLLVTLADHDKYLAALGPAFDATQSGRHKRLVAPDNQLVASDNAVASEAGKSQRRRRSAADNSVVNKLDSVVNYKLAPRQS